MSGTDAADQLEYDYDVVVVGGGPAGCSAGVFTARDGLDTVIFDRGRSSIKRCAHLENYLGFPAGIDVETLYGLMHDHAERAGCELVADMVESVDHRADADGFVVALQEREPVTARRVVAATRYDGDYLRGLDDEAAMFETYEYDGAKRERFDGSYADHEGKTPVEGLYVASPSDEADQQAIVAAGRGARVARRVAADARLDDGWWEQAATRVDWLQPAAEFDDGWTDREAVVERFDASHAADAPVAPESERYRRVREEAVEMTLDQYLTPAEIERRAETGHRTLASHVDVGAVVDAVGEATLLDAMDDDEIRAYLDDRRVSEVSD
jgi:hypothetical protein